VVLDPEVILSENVADLGELLGLDVQEVGVFECVDEPGTGVMGAVQEEVTPRDHGV
jgi:hypothetical protein